eukprot:TRINITY_DN3278_c0_g1_i1.p1 TRINITY_DN3278_c0_g1~~TRINITY_DN3278_c0_g1_i1.p1  ORF type:complete len:652 (+),score=137.72 TRINITY_DN3278_c0_g1_i1:121-2076(+)
MTDVDQTFQLVVDFLRRKGFVNVATSIERKKAKVKQLSNAPTRLEAILLKGLLYEQTNPDLSEGEEAPLVATKESAKEEKNKGLSQSMNQASFLATATTRSDPPAFSLLSRAGPNNILGLPPRVVLRHSREPHTPLRDIKRRASSAYVAREENLNTPTPQVDIPNAQFFRASSLPHAQIFPNHLEHPIDEYEDDDDLGFVTSSSLKAAPKDIIPGPTLRGNFELYPQLNEDSDSDTEENSDSDIGDTPPSSHHNDASIFEMDSEPKTLADVRPTKKLSFSISKPDPKKKKAPAPKPPEDEFAEFNILSNPGDPKLECFPLKVIYRRSHTGFEESRDFPIRLQDIVAGRYEITGYIGSAAFSRAVRCIDHKTGQPACMKIIKNNKDFFDQCLDELKLLKYIKANGDPEKYHVLQMFDYFYFKEHLFIVCELLLDNLYEFYKKNMNNPDEPHYFNLSRVQKVAKQCLIALQFIHGLNLIHCDLKPENILMKNVERCEIKVIDFGSSCYTTDVLSTYVQSRSYRAPEVILGLPYGQKIDMWSLGCILAELLTGRVIFHNYSVVTLLARIIGIIGNIPDDMMVRGNFVDKYFNDDGELYENTEIITPKKTTLQRRVRSDDLLFLDFLKKLLTIDPEKRPSATEALQHPWLRKVYD